MDEKEIEALAHRMAWRYAKSQDPHHSDTYTFNWYCLLRFVDELLAKARVTAAPAPHPDTADAERWRQVLRSVYLLRQGEYVLRPGRPNAGRDDSIGGQWLRRDVDAAIDAARAQAQKVGVGHNLAKCNETLRAAGKAYPRTCAECGLGPCRAQAQKGE